MHTKNMSKALSLQTPAVTLSFDDGWRSAYENAFPILEKAGLRGTFYIVSSYLDDSQFPMYMNASQILELERAGNEIGCHTVSHRHLSVEPDHIVKSEVLLSTRHFRDLGLTIDTFAYPFGEYDDRVLKIVREAGFMGARSVKRGYNLKSGDDKVSDRFLLRIQAVKASTLVQEVCSWIDEAVNCETWLILMFHQIDREGREWSATPETLGEIVDYLKKSDVRTITVREGVKELWSL